MAAQPALALLAALIVGVIAGAVIGRAGAADGVPAPLLTALASLMAAIIGGCAAIIVAMISRDSARKIAVDNAHRAYRQDLARSTIASARGFLLLLQQMAIAGWIKDFDSCRKLVSEETITRSFKTDLRDPDDAVLARAVRLFVMRRLRCQLYLRAVDWAQRDSSEPNGASLTCLDLNSYMAPVVAALEVAAEGYEFDLADTRTRAAELLDKIDDTLTIEAHLDRNRRQRVEERTPQSDAAGV